MARFKGGEKVERGVYINRRTGEILNLMNSGGLLPSGGDAEYTRIPAAAMIIFGPLIGLVYVVFLPFIAFGMLIWYAMDRLIRLFTPVHERVMGMAAPAWSPAESYLDGKTKAPTGEGDAEEAELAERPGEESIGDLLSELEKEIEERKRQRGE